MATPSSSLAAVVAAFAAGDITEETIGCVKEEMRGASIEEQYAVLNALRNACTTTEMATMQAFVDLFSCDEAAPGLLEFFSEKVASEPPKSRPIPQVDGEESTDLMRAALAGDVALLQSLLLAGAPVDQMRPDGRTALMFAAQGGHLDAMIMLVEHGADIAHVHAEGGTVLMQACRPGGLECARWLLDQGADVNQAKPEGTTAVTLAAQENDAELVAFLHARGADLNSQFGGIPFGRTVLMLACGTGAIEAVQTLLDLGASTALLSINDDETSSCLDMAAAGGMGSIGLLELLLGHPAYPVEHRPQALQMMLSVGRVHHLTAFLEHPSEQSVRTVDKLMEVESGEPPLTPMANTCWGGVLQSVQLLSSHGADRGTVDPEWPPDDDLDPPLSSAEQCARHGEHAHVLTWLIESRGWRTPLHHISCMPAPRARKLLRAGADPLAPGNDATGLITGIVTTPLALAEAWLVTCAADLAACQAACTAAGASPPDSAELPGMEACELLVRACEPWSPANHSLFPAPARARAVELLCVGHHAFANKGPLLDCWREYVMPMSIDRASGL